MLNNTPYDTGKVKIGLLYSPPQPVSTPESDWIQGVLLGDRGGMSDVGQSTLQSLAAVAVILIGIFLLGGFTNA